VLSHDVKSGEQVNVYDAVFGLKIQFVCVIFQSSNRLKPHLKQVNCSSLDPELWQERVKG